MKTLNTSLALLILSSLSLNVEAGEVLRCYLNYQSKKIDRDVGLHVLKGFSRDEVVSDLSDTEPTVFGRAIAIDLSKMRDLDSSRIIRKRFRSADFGGEVEVMLGFRYAYAGENAVGPTEVEVRLQHLSKHGREYASAVVGAALHPNVPVTTEVVSGRKGLEYAEIECSVSNVPIMTTEEWDAEYND